MDLIRGFITQQNQIFVILGLIIVAMIVDFATGYANAWKNKEVRSSIGIDGLLRKIISIIVLMFLMPLMALFPEVVGDSALIVIYLAYLALEFTSIIENCKKLGIPIGPLEIVLGMLKTKTESIEGEIKND